MMITIQVIHSGFFTTVQGKGRFGYQKAGVSVGGAMDSFASRLANLLVGNDADEATLEITMNGPTLRFDTDALIAICGGSFRCTLNSEPVSMWKPLFVRKGDVLSIGACQSGYRAYVAFAGGLNVPPVMNSRSTYVQAGIGGFHGRALRSGDVLPLRAPVITIQEKPVRWGIAFSERNYINGKKKIVRVAEGPEYGMFTAQSQERFFASVYEVTTQSDRMGYRLQGQALERATNHEMISEAVTFGTIQVPASGQPIVLMADCQTTGGYPRIAQVISADLPILAQARPGDYIQFQKVSWQEAQRLYVEREQQMKKWKMIIQQKWREMDDAR
ncbi:biotin-dependent carboxyltransferase family protein [Parageobacillus thermoglucosidasius]|uniref:5-oxoprolinase subunit C family protein n=1 Tax=Parageobacillus thermoglucosidasius TaxID=1426 RepID=UPI002E1A80BE|nr:biotin-dependent carboxyltransferase family protein [Parageobacillus thermoglucosidasius]MED4915962.1 biotin-dependent carboxyltransferase family protein [Parageobacillus thermoglucosidasius]MED4947068.1 biotin-dependent carboxyltransferase family protein [Parageobacillus thermoglucosidasius]MED4984308.1 biotin-dependent carboxyltransferase family protein [Parageobacillus thermoglucosidasius]